MHADTFLVHERTGSVMISNTGAVQPRADDAELEVVVFPHQECRLLEAELGSRA